MKDKVTLGEEVARLIEKKGWKMSQLADKSKVNYNKLRAIITRKQASTDYETVIKLAEAFGSDGDSLYEITGYAKPYKKPKEEMTPFEMIREGLRRLEEERAEKLSE